MKNYRVIARLDIKGNNLVKGIHLEGLRVLGKPENFAEYYYNCGADELFYQDVVASLYGRNSLNEFISATAKKSFIPLTVSGGIRTLEDINAVLRAGADKVCINTAASINPLLIKEASKKYGSSTIMVAIEAIKNKDGNYYAFTDNGREETGKEVLDWALQLQENGAGELVLTSVDKEGTGFGFDLDLVKLVASRLDIPVIAHGGAGKLDHCVTVINEAKPDALAIASMLHYDFIKRSTFDNNFQEGNTTFLNSGRSNFGTVEPASIIEIKQYLRANKLNCR